MNAITSRAARRVLLGVLVVVVLSTWGAPGIADDDINTDVLGVAIKGYDTVAYFTEGRAVKGTSEFAYSWNDANWYFSSAENRNLFVANPEKYAPNHGGF